MTTKLVFKHRQTTSTPLQMKRRRPAQQRRPSHQHSNSIDQKKGAIDTDKMHIYWWYATNIEKNTDTEDTSKEWKSCTTERRPYNRMKLATLTEFRDGPMSLSESFDPDDPNLIDRFPDHPPETYIGDRPPTLTPTREISSWQRPSKKKKYLSAIPEQGRQT